MKGTMKGMGPVNTFNWLCKNTFYSALMLNLVTKREKQIWSAMVIPSLLMQVLDVRDLDSCNTDDK